MANDACHVEVYFNDNSRGFRRTRWCIHHSFPLPQCLLLATLELYEIK